MALPAYTRRRFSITQSRNERDTYLEKNTGDDVVNLANKLEERVIGEVLQSEFTLSSVTGVSLTENGVAITRNDLSTLEGRPDVLLDGIVSGVLTNLRLHLAQPEKNLLVGETVKGTGETIQGSTEGEEGIGEGGADQFTGVSRDVTTFMITDRRIKIGD